MQDIADKLLSLISRLGPEIVHDHRRCEACIRDLLGERNKREAAVLIGAVRLRAAEELLAHRSTASITISVTRLVERLHDEAGFDRDLCQWAIATWAHAVGLGAIPQTSDGISIAVGRTGPQNFGVPTSVSAGRAAVSSLAVLDAANPLQGGRVGWWGFAKFFLLISIGVIALCALAVFYDGYQTRGETFPRPASSSSEAPQAQAAASPRVGSDAFANGKAAYERRSYSEALGLLMTASKLNDGRAELLIGRIFANGDGVSQDYGTAFQFFRLALQHGENGAWSHLGQMYLHGEGVPQDDALALKDFRSGAETGDARAQGLLGLMLAMGQGGSVDAKQAFDWFSKAAAQGDADGQTNLAISYLKGSGVAPDRMVAKQWLQKAAAQGNKTATDLLRTLDNG